MSQYVVRNLSALAAVLCTLIGLSNCSIPPGNEQPVTLLAQDIPIQETTVVNIFQCREEISQPLQQAIAQYTAANGNARINVHTLAGSDYGASLRSKLLSGGQADIFMLFSHTDFLTLSGHLENLNDLQWAGAAAGNVLEPAIVDENLYGIPYSLESMGLIANRNIFESIDIPADALSDWETLLPALEKLDGMLERRELKALFPDLNYVIDFSIGDKNYLEKYAAAILLGEAFASAPQAATTAGAAFDKAENLRDFFDAIIRLSPPKNWQSLEPVSQASQISDFAAEKTALLLADTAAYRQICLQNPGLENRLAFLPVSLPRQAASIYLHAPAYWAINAAAADAAKAEAKKFLTWLYQSDSGTAVLAGRFSAVSPYRQYAKDTGIPLHSRMLQYIANGQTKQWLFRESPADWGRMVFAPALQQYCAGTLDWEELLTACNEGWAKTR